MGAYCHPTYMIFDEHSSSLKLLSVVTIKQTKTHVKQSLKLFQNYNFVTCTFLVQR